MLTSQIRARSAANVVAATTAQSPMKEHMSNQWNKAVAVRIGTGISDAIKGPGEAFEALNNRWPAEHGPQYVEAKRLCTMAVGGTLSVEIAREAFISAAVEASVLA